MEIFALNMLRLQFKLEAINTINLPEYKGSAFHGGFGHALQKISPTWFRYFYQPAAHNIQHPPKPFVLLPPLDKQQTYQPGETFNCEITLLAEATQHIAIVQAAIEYLGGEMGLGYSRGKFKIKDLTTSSFTTTPVTPKTLTLSFITRVRLKKDNRLLKSPPEFALFINRLFGRLKTLQQAYSEKPIEEQQYQHFLQQANAIQLMQSNVQWDDWDRYSGNQQQWMKFGGLLGEISFQGDLKPFISCLQMGEWTHVGGKSSFGLGKYIIQSGENYEITTT